MSARPPAVCFSSSNVIHTRKPQRSTQNANGKRSKRRRENASYPAARRILSFSLPFFSLSLSLCFSLCFPLCFSLFLSPSEKTHPSPFCVIGSRTNVSRPGRQPFSRPRDYGCTQYRTSIPRTTAHEGNRTVSTHTQNEILSPHFSATPSSSLSVSLL